MMIQSYYGEIYSTGYDGGDQHYLIVEHYLNQWELIGRPSPVLEPMCGTGLNLIPFLEAGADIDGLDSSPHMLAECRKACAAKGLNPKLYQQFLEAMELPQRYSFAFIPGGSFGHIYDKTIALRCLTRLWEHMLPGGSFALDLRTPDYRKVFAQPGHAEFSVDDRADGSTIFATSVWGDKDNGRVIRCWNKMERFVDGRLRETEILDYHERFYDQSEFITMLQVVGFVDIEVAEAYPGHAMGEHNWFVYLCRKPEL